MIKRYLFALLLLLNLPQGIAEQQQEAGILHSQGLLWKIEKPGLPHSYLFGTMHVSDPRVTTLSDEVEQAFTDSGHFVMEMILSFKAVGTVTSASFFNDGRTLDQVMDSASYQRLLGLINQRLLVPEKTLRHMKPWAVLIMLMMPVEQQVDSAAALDMVLLRRASLQKKKLTGLETAEEQVAVFESLTIEEQVWMLNRAIDEIARTDAQMPDMLNAYLQGDLAALVRLQQQFMYDDSDIDDRFMHELLDVRNHRMAKRLQSVLQEGNAFIAIGALHLPGQQGVLGLLEQQGYRVSPVR